MGFLQIVPGNSLQEQSLQYRKKKLSNQMMLFTFWEIIQVALGSVFIWFQVRQAGYIHTSYSYSTADPFFLSELAISDQDYSKQGLHNGER